jgi:phosphoribosylaminoimidazole carboxylase PurE protein
VKEAEPRGLKVLIAGAGGAAALPGFLAAETILPVIGVPIASTPLNGLDSSLSMAQMPKGVPVATVAIGSWGASNAALLAAEIIALSDEAVKKRLLAYKAQLASGVEESSKRLEERIKRKV